MKAIVIGLDAASPRLIEKWMDKLPNLKRLSEQGVHGVLKSVVPPSSIPSWQCFATGKNPAKIGNLGFLYIDKDLKIKHGRTTPDMGCIWDLCSRAGLKVGVFNVPGTQPPYRVNGFMVSGFPIHRGKAWAYPASLMKKLDSAVDGYDVDVPLAKPSKMKGGEKAYLMEVEKLHRKSVKSAKLLIEWSHPDLFVMTLQGLDMIQHHFWRFMDDPESEYANVVLDWYVKMDDAVGELTRALPDDAYILVLSDHGSTTVSSTLYINELLKSQGLLTSENGRSETRNGGFHKRVREFALKHVSPRTIRAIYRFSPEFISKQLTVSAEMERVLEDLVQNIDWNQTLAFSTGGHEAAIYVNSRPNAPKELSIPQTHSEVVRKLCDLLDNITDPASGKKVHPVFHRKQDVFQGRYQDEAPDLCVELFDGDKKIQVNPRLNSGRVWSSNPHFSAIHSRDGFWALAGPQVRQGLTLDTSILDMAPTLSRLLSVRGAEDFDGHVVESAFSTVVASYVQGQD